MTLLRAGALIAAWMVVSLFAFAVVLPTLGGSAEDLAHTLLPFTAALLGFTGPCGAALVVFGAARGTGRRVVDLGWDPADLPRSIGPGLIGGAAAVAWTFAIVFAMGISLPDIVEAAASPSLGERAVYLLIGLQAGFVEESLFRSGLLGTLEQRMPARAALVSHAALFAAYHLQGPIGLLGKFGTGLIFGALRQRTGALWSSALAHALLWTVVGLM